MTSGGGGAEGGGDAGGGGESARDSARDGHHRHQRRRHHHHSTSRDPAPIEVQISAATRIQAVWRGFRAWRERGRLQLTKRKMAAAQVVQTTWRAYAAVRKVQQLRLAKREHEAAVMIQAAWRGHALRLLLAVSPQPQPVELPAKRRMAMVDYMDASLVPSVEPSLHNLMHALQENWAAAAARSAEIEVLAKELEAKEEALRRERETNPSYIPPPLAPGEMSPDSLRAALVMDVEPLEPCRALASLLCETSIRRRVPVALEPMRRSLSSGLLLRSATSNAELSAAAEQGVPRLSRTNSSTLMVSP
ncbi:uncharacterized protein AMSG_03580 [Thecamonas trahens ATCC 50062]|uniref:Uncharacterized protein n=1 Tax=Thecamonas trahens ATCC 50062 TaxID=461836 RepID=A0A0L0D467_THETB|nr:hypothetical protein AMSG_03580 [Thecamonas trahens ATCC 50062]KNC47152.1 hypothetical protein AMSG_03580 [Thecamonas trahens ATCC 50062]|eukprot:XP_013759926.1 hypothetical protein AMSG_03580 [Thecamonas trahens ATCC 50062]